MKKIRIVSAMLAVCLCALMATVGLTIVPGNVAASSSWGAKTIQGGHYCHIATITTPYGSGREVDTNNSPDWAYEFMGLWSGSYTVGTARAVEVTGNFSLYDDFIGDGRVDRSYVSVYILDSTKATILGQQKVLDYRDSEGTWYMRTAFFSGMTQGATVYVGVGRSDSWSTDHKLTASWASTHVTTPSCPAWSHAYDGPMTIEGVKAGMNLLTLEADGGSQAIYASSITGHSRYATDLYGDNRGLVTGVQTQDVYGNVWSYGSYYGSTTDFVLPTGCSFWAHATANCVIDLGWYDSDWMHSVVLSNQQYIIEYIYGASAQYTGNNLFGMYLDYWYAYGTQFAPPHMLPPIGGGGGGYGGYRASDVASKVLNMGGTPFTGPFIMSAWNATTQDWMQYGSGGSGVNFPVFPHTGLLIQPIAGSSGKIVWLTS